jgi:hypothetical protein
MYPAAMTALHVLGGAIDDERRAELVMAGDLLVFRELPALHDLCATVEGLIGETPDGDEAVCELRRRVHSDEQVKRMLAAALESAGVDGRRTYWDKYHLRVQPPQPLDAEKGIGSLAYHRDTWSSNLYAQANWWSPIRPLSAGRTIAFYPAYWNRPLANTSAEWRLEDVRAGRAPLVPEPTEPVDTASELRVVIEPGDLLCFSGAHLHASVPNTTSEARISIEVRSVNPDDTRDGRTAPNLDGHAAKVQYGWFWRMADGEPLAPPAN